MPPTMQFNVFLNIGKSNSNALDYCKKNLKKKLF